MYFIEIPQTYPFIKNLFCLFFPLLYFLNINLIWIFDVNLIVKFLKISFVSDIIKFHFVCSIFLPLFYTVWVLTVSNHGFSFFKMVSCSCSMEMVCFWIFFFHISYTYLLSVFFFGLIGYEYLFTNGNNNLFTFKFVTMEFGSFVKIYIIWFYNHYYTFLTLKVCE